MAGVHHETAQYFGFGRRGRCSRDVQINSDHKVTYPYQFPFYGNVLLLHHGGGHR